VLIPAPHLRPYIYSPLTTCMLHPSAIPASHPLVDYFILSLTFPPSSYEIVFFFLIWYCRSPLRVPSDYRVHVFFFVPLFSLCLFFFAVLYLLIHTVPSLKLVSFIGIRLSGPRVRSLFHSIVSFPVRVCSQWRLPNLETVVWHWLWNQTNPPSFSQATGLMGGAEA